MENANYLVTTSDEDMYYLLIDKKYTPQESLEYFLKYDFPALLEFIATVKSPSTLLYYWRAIESLDTPPRLLHSVSRTAFLFCRK